MWPHMCVILSFESLRQEDKALQESSGYMVSLRATLDYVRYHLNTIATIIRVRSTWAQEFIFFTTELP